MKTFSEILNDAAKDVKEIDIFQLKKLLDDDSKFSLIDIREDNELLHGKINKAEHIGRGVLEKSIEGHVFDREEEIVLYCARGVRSVLGCKSLQEMGYAKVFSLKGGIGDWINAGFPLVSND